MTTTRNVRRIASLSRLAACPGATPSERQLASERLADHLAIKSAAPTLEPVLVTGDRVVGMWGVGTVAYVSSGGWIGVRLDGETRIDEYPGAHLTRQGGLLTR